MKCGSEVILGKKWIPSHFLCIEMLLFICRSELKHNTDALTMFSHGHSVSMILFFVNRHFILLQCFSIPLCYGRVSLLSFQYRCISCFHGHLSFSGSVSLLWYVSEMRKKQTTLPSPADTAVLERTKKLVLETDWKNRYFGYSRELQTGLQWCELCTLTSWSVCDSGGVHTLQDYVALDSCIHDEEEEEDDDSVQVVGHPIAWCQRG